MGFEYPKYSEYDWFKLLDEAKYYFSRTDAPEGIFDDLGEAYDLWPFTQANVPRLKKLLDQAEKDYRAGRVSYRQKFERKMFERYQASISDLIVKIEGRGLVTIEELEALNTLAIAPFSTDAIRDMKVAVADVGTRLRDALREEDPETEWDYEE